MTPSDWVELAGHVVWPVTVLILGIVMRRQIGDFLSAVAGRITHVSVMSVSLDLAVATEASPPWQSDIGDVRGLVAAHDVNDSYFGTLRESLLRAEDADFIVVDLKSEGRQEWLTSRLYLFTYLLGRLKGVRAVVFVATRGDTNRTFLGVVPADELLSVLAQQNPRFRLARLQAESEQFGRLVPDSTSMGAEPVRSPPTEDPMVPEDSDQWWSRQDVVTPYGGPLNVAERFLTRLQWAPPPPVPPDPPAGWLQLPPTPGQPERWEYASWVTAADLTDGILAPIVRPDDWVIDDRAWSPADRVHALAQSRGDFIALLSASRRFERLVDRRALLETMGGDAVESLTRS